MWLTPLANSVIFDVGGAYIQQLQVGGTETGTLQVDGNSILSGDASIGGSIAVAGSAEINGSVSDNGETVTGLSTPSCPNRNTHRWKRYTMELCCISLQYR